MALATRRVAPSLRTKSGDHVPSEDEEHVPSPAALAENAMAVPWRLTHTTRSDRRVFSRSAVVVGGRLVSKLAIVLFLIVAARLLSPEEYGVYSYVLVLAYTVAILADAQVSIIAGRDVAAGQRSLAVAYWSAWPIVLIGGVLGALALVAFGLTTAGPGSTAPMLLIAGAFVVLNRLYSLGLDMLRAVGRFGAEASIETAGTVLLVAAATTAAASGAGVIAVLAVFAVHSLLAALVCHLLLRQDFGSRVPAPGYRLALLRRAIKLAISAGATAAATRVPLIVLGITASAVTVAGYSVAMRFADAIYLLALTAGQALLPNIASLLPVDGVRAARLTRRAIALTIVAGSAIALVCVPFGSAITSFVFGDAYASAGSLTSTMLLSVPFMGMFWISWFALCAYGRERDILLVALFCSAGSVLCAVITVPGSGAGAAAWVYVGTLATLALGNYSMLELQIRRVKAAVR